MSTVCNRDEKKERNGERKKLWEKTGKIKKYEGGSIINRTK